MTFRKLISIFAIGLILASLLVTATGCSTSTSNNTSSDFPKKPIQLIVSYSPGAATDTQARIIAKYAKKYLGQELIIVNKPGGSGAVGWNYFSEVEADGYILAVYNLPVIITQPLVGETQFNLETFDPIFNWGQDPTVFAVTADSPIKDLDDLIKKARKAPGVLTVGTAGKFVGQHLAILQLETQAEIDLKDIPYKGAADSIASLLGKHTDLISGNLSDMYRLGDQVRILAIATKDRHTLAPNVPTFEELGYSDVYMSTDRGIAAKKGTPLDVIEKLEKGFLDIMKDSEFLMDMQKAGADMLLLDRSQTIEEFKIRQVNYEELINNINIDE